MSLADVDSLQHTDTVLQFSACFSSGWNYCPFDRLLETYSSSQTDSIEERVENDYQDQEAPPSVCNCSAF